jgi:DNA-binding response OmpR family regulator
MMIAVLGRDPIQVGHLCQWLSTAEHECHVFTESLTLLGEIRRGRFNLLLCAEDVCDMSSVQLLSCIRQMSVRHIPVVVLNSTGSDPDIVATLRAGADDCIAKPVSPVVLIARVDALLRRSYQLNSSVFSATYGEFEFHFGFRRVWFRGTPIALSCKEFDLAALLFQYLNRPLSRAQILEVVWSERASKLHTRTVDTHILMLRTKLGLRPEHGFRLLAVYGYGYRLEQLADCANPSAPDQANRSEANGLSVAGPRPI